MNRHASFDNLDNFKRFFVCDPDNSSVYEPKQAYITAKTMDTVLKGFKYVKRIATKDTNDYVMLFTNEKNEKRLAVWTTIVNTNGHNISIASDECDFEVIDHKGSLVKKVSSSGQTVVIAITDFVQFLVDKCNNNTLLEKQPGTEIFDVQVMFNRGMT